VTTPFFDTTIGKEGMRIGHTFASCSLKFWGQKNKVPSYSPTPPQENKEGESNSHQIFHPQEMGKRGLNNLLIIVL
jgi:hypothetical protein